jgi:hypothetical protein
MGKILEASPPTLSATPSIKLAMGEQLQGFGASLLPSFLPLSSSLHHVCPEHTSFEVLIFFCDTFLSTTFFKFGFIVRNPPISINVFIIFF